MRTRFLRAIPILLLLLMVGALSSCGVLNGTLGIAGPTTKATVSFDGAGGTAFDDVTATVGKKITRPEDPTRPGYTFVGWTDGDGFWDFEIDVVREDTTLRAVWVLKTYTVAYELGGGENAAANPTVYTVESASVALGTPTRAGYEFLGWYLDGAFSGTALSSLPVSSAADVTLYAKWAPITYDIVYDLGGGVNATGNPTLYDPESGDITLAHPTRDGYLFAGWYTSSDFSGEPIETVRASTAADVTLYARWTAKLFDIQYTLGGGTHSANPPITYDLETGNVTLGVATRRGYTFLGWYLDGVRVTEIDATLCKNLTLVAKWETVRYEITYDMGGGVNASGNPKEFTVENGTLSLAAPAARDGYTFLGWYIGDKKVTEIDVTLCENITIRAEWKVVLFDITYNLGADNVQTTNPATFDVETGNVTLTDPIRVGYKFLGWYTTPDFKDGSEITVIHVTILREITIYAKWEIIKFNINYELGDRGEGATNENPIQFDVTTGSLTLQSPSKGGYNFGGWYSDPECTKPVTILDFTILEHITLYAKWEIKNYYITYVLNGGNRAPGSPTSFHVEMESLALLDAVRDGYTFLGWYYEEDFSGERVYEIDLSELSDVVLYAKWIENSYTLNYALGGGSLTEPNVSSYKPTDGSIFLFSPMLAGKFFGGFYLDEDFTARVLKIEPSYFAGIPNGTVVTLYARWFDTAEEAYAYTVKDGAATITGYLGAENTVTVPATLGGYPVTAIGNKAFDDCDSILTLTLPAGITAIGNQAFNSCSNMTEITLPEGILSIGGAAFGNCRALTSLVVPKSVVSLGNAVFGGCASLKSLEIPFIGQAKNSLGTYATIGYLFGNTQNDGMVQIAQRGTSSNNTQSYAYLPEGLEALTVTNATSFGGGALSGCFMLKSVSISLAEGATLSVIPSYFLEGCTALETLTLPEGYTEIGKYAFSGCAALTAMPALDGVTTIGAYAFSGCSGIEALTLPEGLTAIGEEAFLGMAKIEELTLPDSLQSIGRGAFSGFASLKKLSVPFVGSTPAPTAGSSASLFGYIFGTKSYEGGVSALQYAATTQVNHNGHTYYLPAGLTEVTVRGGTIPFGAFSNCKLLEKINLPAELTAIGDYAFYCCEGLTEVTLPGGITAISNNLFRGCSALKTVNHGSGVTTIGDGAFYGCRALEYTLPAGLTALGPHAFYACQALTSVTVPSGISVLPASVFAGCSGATSITLHDGITSIGQGAFSNCSALVNITLPKGLTAIPENLFLSCYALKSIEIPASVTSIGSQAFSHCVALTSITIPEKVEAIGERAFMNCTAVKTLYFNAKAVNSFASTYVFSCLGANGDGVTVYIGDAVTLIPDNFLCPSSTNVFSTYAPNVVAVSFAENGALKSIGKYAFYGAKITTLTVPSSVTSFGNYCFQNCNSLTSVTLPFLGAGIDSEGTITGGLGSLFSSTLPTALTEVTILGGTINTNAFFKTPGIEKVTLGAGVYGELPKMAFYNCPALREVDLSASRITSLGEQAFYNSSVLETVKLPATLTAIGADALYNATSLKNLEIPASVTSIGNRAFGKTALTEVTIPAGVTVLPGSIFAECKSLVTVNLPEGLTEIGTSAFKDCSALVTITLPASLETIGSYAFSGCSLLSAITIPDKVELLPAYLFEKCYALGTVNLGRVKTISTNTFASCVALSELVIPDTVTAIGSGALYGCRALTKLTVPFLGTSATAQGKEGLLGALFSDVSATYAKKYDGGVLVKQAYGQNLTYQCYIPEKLTSVTVKGGKLAYGAFSNCVTLTEIGITGVAEIGERAFLGCTALASIEIPSTVTAIGAFAFTNCEKLEALVIPDSVMTIGQSILAGCRNIKNLTVPFIGVSRNEPMHFGYFYSTSSSYGGSQTPQYEAVTEGAKPLTGTTKLYYTYSPEKLTVTGGSLRSGALSNLKIKRIILGDGVTSVGAFAFFKSGQLTEVQLPVSLKSINTYYLFAGCTSLKTVNLPAGLTEIGKYAFYECKALPNITLPAGVTSIGDYAFTENNALASINLPAGLTSIGAAAFFKCTALSGIVTLPAGCTSIGADAFAYSGISGLVLPDTITAVPAGLCNTCPELKEITIPASVTSIGKWAFAFCKSLEKIYYNAAEVADFTTETDIFRMSGSESDTGIELIIGARVKRVPAYLLGQHVATDNYKPVVTKITFAEGSLLEEIGAYSLYCTGITSLALPASLKTIGNGAFSSCTGLTELTIPAGVESIGLEAFRDCPITKLDIPFLGTSETEGTAYSRIYGVGETLEMTVRRGVIAENAATSPMKTRLAKLTLLDGVTAIGARAFSSCIRLTEASIGSGVSVIPDSCFSGCEALETLTIRGEITSIGDNAFYRCKLLSVIDLSKVESIGGRAFFECTALSGVLDLSSVTAIGERAFYGCTGVTGVSFPRLVTLHEKAFEGSGLTEVTIPGTATDLRESGLNSCPSLKSVTVSEGVETLPAYFFGGCKELLSVSLPESLRTIGKSAFNACYKLTALTIPSGVTEIGETILYSCSGIERLSVPFIGKNADEASRIIYFFDNRNAPASLTSVTVTNAKTIAEQAFLNLKELTEVSLNDEITSIGDNAFSGSGVLSVTLPKGVCELGSIFRGAYNLQTVVLHGGVTAIPDNAFYGCRALTRVDFGGKVTSIGKQAFHGTGFVELVIPEGVETIGEYAFGGCQSLKSISLPKTITSIGEYAFSVCYAVEEVYYNAENLADFAPVTGIFKELGKNGDGITLTIGKDVRHIPAHFFYTTNMYEREVPFLTAIVFEEGSRLESIGNYAFHYAVNLSEVVFPAGLQSIGQNAFAYGYRLTRAVIPASVTTVGGHAFTACPGLTVYLEADTLPEGFDDAWLAGKESYVLSYKTNDVAKDGCIYLIKDGIRYAIKDGKAAVAEQARVHVNVVIPETVTYGDVAYPVTEVRAAAFNYMTTLQTVVLPTSVTLIGMDAFSSCAFLESVELGSYDNWYRSGVFTDAGRIDVTDAASAAEKIKAHSGLGYCEWHRKVD